MKRKKADEYHVTEAEFRKFLHDYPQRDEMEEINRKYLPPNKTAEQAIKDDDRAEGHWPTRAEIEDQLSGFRIIPPDAELKWKYLDDKTAVFIAVSDGKEFFGHMSKELFKRLGLDKRAKEWTKND